MNFLQLASRVAEELHDYPLPLSTVDLGTGENGEYLIVHPVQRKAVRAVQAAFDRVIEFSRHWKFLNKRGTIFQFEPGLREYRKSGIESVEWDSLYITRPGQTTRWPIYKEEYDSWQDRERYMIPTSSIPMFLIWGPSPDRWIVWPTPAEQWVLNGNWQLRKPRLEVATDEPPWHEKYHELLVWLAVMQIEARERVQEDVTTPVAVSASQRAFQGLWSPFLGEYLPKPRAAEALL